MNASPYTQNIVIDLEFTPVSGVAGLRNEIIEIGAVRVLPDGRVADEFRCAVRPQLTTTIAPHVRRLTGLRWSDVCSGCTFSEALERLSAWIGAGATRMVAWSPVDRAQLMGECAVKGVALPANMVRWLDLQAVFPRVLGKRRPGQRMALHAAVRWYGTELDSCSEHAALLDAEHTAELLQLLLTGEYREHLRALEEAAAPAHPAGFNQLAAALGPLLASLSA